MLASDDRAVVLVTATGQRNGRDLDERQVAIFDINAGRITQATFVYEDPEAYDRFWDD